MRIFQEMSQAIKMGVWLASLAVVVSALLPIIGAVEQRELAGSKQNMTSSSNTTVTTVKRTARAVDLESAASVSMPTKMILGDSIGLDTALESHHDLMPAAGEHKKYVLVKKKPKHKKIKMEIYKPKMKYKKIKMKVPVKKMKKKKVKGYLVKKEKHEYH